jgi:hypothetical protein
MPNGEAIIPPLVTFTAIKNTLAIPATIRSVANFSGAVRSPSVPRTTGRRSG